MKKKLIRLTESDLHRIVKESVNRVINEMGGSGSALDVKQMEDMDNIGREFIDFIEKYHGGVLLQTIVDFESGNETGTPTSPLPSIIPEFEEAVIGRKCTPEMRKAIKRAYNEWWYYAQGELMNYEQ